MSSTTLIIGDTHAPYHHPDTLRFLRRLQREYRPARVIHVGDECDLHQFSRYRKSPAVMSPRDEIKASRAFVAELAAIFPRLDLCHSNHVSRLAARASDAGLPDECLRAWREIIDAPPAWRWAESWQVGDAVVMHGNGYSGSDVHLKAAIDEGQNTVIGHVHTTCGVAYHATRSRLIYGVATGCLIDFASPVFDYAREHRKKPVLGSCIIIDGEPRIVTM